MKNGRILTSTIWLIGIGVWVAYIIGLVFLSFGLGSSELSLFSQFVFSVYNLFVVLFVTLVFIRTLIDNSDNNINWLKWISIGLFLSATVYFIYQNTIAHSITFDPNINDSPFDQRWYSCTQTWYGYPGPFFRILSEETPQFGKYIIDFSSLTFNLVILMFVGYLIAGGNLLTQKIIRTTTKTKND